jgi:hypothetical protein
MDDALTALATSGAQTIVNLMATDAWQKTKRLVAQIFSRDKSDGATDTATELEVSRAKIIAAHSSLDNGVQQHELDRWEARLRLRLLEDDEMVASVKELIEIAAGQQFIGSAGPADISMRADAKGNSRIYQQGQGVQHNG